jgi:hypothetical protein
VKKESQGIPGKKGQTEDTEPKGKIPRKDALRGKGKKSKKAKGKESAPV